MDRPNRLNWPLIAPIAALVLALLAIAWLDLATGGEAEPEPFLGTIGTPVRGAYVAPTATPEAAAMTPVALPTFVGTSGGAMLERDARRRGDLIRLLVAANAYHEREDEYPSSGGNVQTLCNYREFDAGCALEETYGAELPIDPKGDPIENGYWYESDGETVTIYAALELPIPETERCPTDDPHLAEKTSLVCITAP